MASLGNKEPVTTYRSVAAPFCRLSGSIRTISESFVLVTYDKLHISGLIRTETHNERYDILLRSVRYNNNLSLVLLLSVLGEWPVTQAPCRLCEGNTQKQRGGVSLPQRLSEPRQNLCGK